MQHIVHIFIGEELVSLRDQFASVFRNLHKDIRNPYFTALTVIKKDKSLNLCPDSNGDSFDTGEIELEKTESDLYNYFQNLYHRKVTVHNKGNESLVVVLWAKLFLDGNEEIFKQLIATLSKLKKKIY